MCHPLSDSVFVSAFDCSCAAAIFLGVLRNLHSPLYCLGREDGGVGRGAVVGFFLMCS